MSDSKSNHIASYNFSVAFEQMCNFVAVSKTGDAEGTVLGLVQLCFTILPDESISQGSQLVDVIDGLFGVKVPLPDAEHALNKLYKQQMLSSDTNGRYVLAPVARAAIQSRIDDATTLEDQIKASWLAEISVTFPELAPDKAWASLKGYLFRAFRRHGIQSASLLDPAFPVDPTHEISLAALLKQATGEHFPPEDRADAERAVAGFLAELGRDSNRSKYITQLADAAFNFYTLEVPPEISETLRTRLRDLTLFLDTNFLFGILGLHYNSQADVSHELLRAISVHALPFRLRFHEATQDEMRRTISYFSDVLRSRQWSRSLSRAASESRQLTGIEQKFHERNALQPLDIDEFLRPIQHFDALLAEQSIKIFRSSKDRMGERSELYHEYREFLEQNGRPDKIYETIQHDATVLDATRLLRTNAKSSLDAGALLVTCDYLLYKFDHDTSRRTGQLPCVVLPNMLWQLLRPYIKTDADFERSFAETFALPEFRAIGSGGAKACSKMLSILATYKDMPERTALHLMTDGMLIGRLQSVTTDEEFTKLVESAIVEDNRNLLEETASLRKSVAELAESEKKTVELLRNREQELQDVKKGAEETIESQRTQVVELQSRLEVIEEAKRYRRTLVSYLFVLVLIVLTSFGLGWLMTGLLSWWEKVVGKGILCWILAILLFLGSHLLFEQATRRNERMTNLWPFVQVRRFRAWLWSFLILGFMAGVIGNLVANTMQTRIDQLESETHDTVPPAAILNKSDAKYDASMRP